MSRFFISYEVRWTGGERNRGFFNDRRDSIILDAGTPHLPNDPSMSDLVSVAIDNEGLSKSEIDNCKILITAFNRI